MTMNHSYNCDFIRSDTAKLFTSEAGSLPTGARKVVREECVDKSFTSKLCIFSSTPRGRKSANVNYVNSYDL